MKIPILELMWYLMVYSLLGWCVEVFIFALRNRTFVNRGLLDLPFALPYGITAVLLMVALPELNGQPLAQFVLTYLIFRLVWGLSEHFIRRISGAEPSKRQYKRRHVMAITAAIALVFYIQYLLVQPLILLVSTMLPRSLIRIGGALFLILITADFFCVRHALRRHRRPELAQRSRSRTQALADRMSNSIWDRLQRTYPGITEETTEHHVFAEGLCFDKLFWVFLVSSVLGAAIEMVFCRVKGGVWMNRSSLLYGPFSVVWGLGAVILTVVLQRLSDKPDRHIFAAGCLIGGAYEYLCSVFTEYVFGTVFWDYSQMPLNLGGRINLLYCIFWGLLAVLWLRVLYPPMERCIEKLPPLSGKVITWILVVLMVLNAVLTTAAMLRYTDRQTEEPRTGIVESYLDSRYPDEFMEQRWPNMIITE